MPLKILCATRIRGERVGVASPPRAPKDGAGHLSIQASTNGAPQHRVAVPAATAPTARTSAPPKRPRHGVARQARCSRGGSAKARAVLWGGDTEPTRWQPGLSLRKSAGGHEGGKGVEGPWSRFRWRRWGRTRGWRAGLHSVFARFRLPAGCACLGGGVSSRGRRGLEGSCSFTLCTWI